MMNSRFKIIIFAVLILVSALIFVFARGNGEREQSELSLDAFAKCLTEKGAVMYGAYWCSHCENEKNRFGDSFRYVRYVECADEPQVCVDAGVEATPTWVFPDGRRFVGEQGLERLSRESGCVLPSGD